MKLPILALAISVCAASAADAALISRLDGRAVYDTDRDITWVADANLAASQAFDIEEPKWLINADGSMTWFAVIEEWLPAVNAHEGTGYLGFDDWRLPTTLQGDHSCTSPYAPVLGSVGQNCTGSELGHLFYVELGGTYGESIFATGNESVGLFTNLDLPSGLGGYWSGSCCAVDGGVIDPTTGGIYDPEDFAYYFLRFDNGTGSENAGGQSAGPKLNHDAWVPWIVRDGDVLAVPEPGTASLLIAGLMLLAGRRPSGRLRERARVEGLVARETSR